jgi:hypothetical protein
VFTAVSHRGAGFGSPPPLVTGPPRGRLDLAERVRVTSADRAVGSGARQRLAEAAARVASRNPK